MPVELFFVSVQFDAAVLGKPTCHHSQSRGQNLQDEAGHGTSGTGASGTGGKGLGIKERGVWGASREAETVGT